MMSTLDRYERVATGHYRRSVVDVEPAGGECLLAEAYVGWERFTTAPGLPGEDYYLQIILTGVREHGLPEHYLRFIEDCGTTRRA